LVGSGIPLTCKSTSRDSVTPQQCVDVAYSLGKGPSESYLSV